jgi:hypothetical protein
LALAMASLTNATSFVSPSADAQIQLLLNHSYGFVDRIAQQWNFWTVSLTILLLAISYDQCASVLGS